MKILLDTSAIIDGEFTRILERTKSSEYSIIIPVAVMDELQSQASTNKEYGFIGLNEIKKIRRLCKSLNIELKILGERPTVEDISLATRGRIDAIINELALVEEATLVTADYVQSQVAEAYGIQTWHIPRQINSSSIGFEDYFDEHTMSVHMKEGVMPVAKRGVPGDFHLETLDNKPATRNELTSIVREVSELCRNPEIGTVEVSLDGATVYQYGSYRIAVTKPPFSDGMECRDGDLGCGPIPVPMVKAAPRRRDWPTTALESGVVSRTGWNRAFVFSSRIGLHLGAVVVGQFE